SGRQCGLQASAAGGAEAMVARHQLQVLSGGRGRDEEADFHGSHSFLNLHLSTSGAACPHGVGTIPPQIASTRLGDWMRRSAMTRWATIRRNASVKFTGVHSATARNADSTNAFCMSVGPMSLE